MNFLTPLAFALAILLPVIVAMYLLKLRRTEKVVSSTYLWQRMVRDLEANTPWQRLRHNLLLILQLLFLLILIFALMRPFTWAESSTSQSTILIFDTSASMAATDLSPNRLETAKEQARLLISNLPENARTTIIAAGESTQVLVSSSQDRHYLHQALDNLQPQPGGSDLISALELASAIAARHPDTEIVIFSDGKVDLPDRLATKGKIRFLPIGINGNNQGITLITLESENSINTMTAYIRVDNFASESSQRRLILSADGKLIDAYDLEIPAKSHISVISEVIPKDTKVLESALTGSDSLPLDDIKWTVQQNTGNQFVTLISDGNRFLETSLGLLPGINLSILNYEDLMNEQHRSTSLDSADLIIFDKHAPRISNLHSPNLLYIGPISSTNTFTTTGSIQSPLPRPVSRTEPILEYVDFSNVSILDATRIILPEWARPLLIDENSGENLIFVGEIEGRRLAVLAFDPRRSDLPLRVAFPILITNLMEWLLPGRIGDIPAQVRSGEVLTFTPPPDITSLKITRPDGSFSQLEIQDGHAIYADTIQLGVYHVSWGDDQSIAFAVNLSNPLESDILPIENLSILEGTSTAHGNPYQQARFEWWRPLAAVALMVLVIEWFVYNRVTLTNLRYQIKRKP